MSTQTSFAGAPAAPLADEAVRGAEGGQDTAYTDTQVFDSDTDSWLDTGLDKSGCSRAGRIATESQKSFHLPHFGRTDTHEDYRRAPEDFLPPPTEMSPEPSVLPMRTAVRAETMDTTAGAEDGDMLDSTADGQGAAPAQTVVGSPADRPRAPRAPGPDAKAVLLFRELDDGTVDSRYEPKATPPTTTPSSGRLSRTTTSLSSTHCSSGPMTDCVTQFNLSVTHRTHSGPCRPAHNHIGAQAERMNMLLGDLVGLMTRIVNNEETGRQLMEQVIQEHRAFIDAHTSRLYARRRREQDYYDGSERSRTTFYDDDRRNNRREDRRDRDSQRDRCDAPVRQNSDLEKRRYMHREDSYDDRYGGRFYG